VEPNPNSLWQGRRVFLTGHTGFKGGWLALWLAHLGAKVRGYSLDPYTTPNLFDVARIGSRVEDIRGDIRDAAALDRAITEFAPEVVFHLAAQPLVRLSYEDPLLTYETNVIGTARVLDAVRRTPSARAVVVVTTDKCYENREWLWGYRESDPLGGYDPYSSSKACAEIVSAAFRQSYFPAGCGVGIATARAGNVIGGGDWSLDRLVPDIIRGLISAQPVTIRRPHAIRPWQHVLEPLHGYMMLAERLLSHDAPRHATAYNFGPAEENEQSVWAIVHKLSRLWGQPLSWPHIGDYSWFHHMFRVEKEDGVHEAGLLKLDSSRARHDLRWSPLLSIDTGLEWLVDWHKAHAAGEDMEEFSLRQIAAYQGRVIREA
jgi:CDP-glucose 4,6-dehydratase